ncbi:hypothetical protein ACO2Q2_11020 [Dyella sp. KRB-257]|uniref:hypothetical protein n=1 Tax=Dyella sp. KRB-257 TaxID=3400915 RepID=UPI003C0AB5DE
MARWHPWIVLVHLSCAIVFIGAVAFEVFVLDALHGRLDNATVQRVEAIVMERARRFMPYVVATLFVTGGLLFELRCGGLSCMGSRFGVWLGLKVLLALGVLAVFIGAVRAGRHGGMDPCRFRHTHRIVLVLMAAIVLLAKTMFVL